MRSILSVLSVVFCLVFTIYTDVLAADKALVLKDGSELVLIPAGKFKMGSDERKYTAPAHNVSLSAFYMAKYEVTNGQYKKYCDANKIKYPDNPKWDSNYFLANPDHPVVNVHWYDASKYAKWAEGRLPTEAEWEYAARGGSNEYYYWGDDLSGSKLNFLSRYEKKRDKWKYTSPVGSFPPNQYGLYDVLGNVWEWVADRYGKNYYKKSPTLNPKGPTEGRKRILKGEAWNSGNNFGAPERWWQSQSSYKYDIAGFRIAKDVK